MHRIRSGRLLLSVSVSLVALLAPFGASAQSSFNPGTWTFAVTGDSRNCGDFR
jgi:hypothetical protein